MTSGEVGIAKQMWRSLQRLRQDGSSFQGVIPPPSFVFCLPTLSTRTHNTSHVLPPQFSFVTQHHQQRPRHRSLVISRGTAISPFSSTGFSTQTLPNTDTTNGQDDSTSGGFSFPTARLRRSTAATHHILYPQKKKNHEKKTHHSTPKYLHCHL